MGAEPLDVIIPLRRRPRRRSRFTPAAAVAALSNDEMLAVGGQGENGQPLGDAWTFSAGSATWHASGLEGEYAAALARAGHTLTPLPPAPYLFGPHDGAYLLFGGLSTPRVARLARFTPHSPEAYADAAADDAAEPDASPVALNDLLLLTRGARKAWSLTRLSLPDACSCRAHPTSVNNKRSVKRSQSASALLPADDLDDYEDDDVKPLSEREVEMQLLGSQQKGSLSEEEAAALQASAVPRAHRPCGRYGHSAHLYVGEIGSSWSSSNTSLLEDQPCGGDGCLLIHAGAANAEHAHTRGTYAWTTSGSFLSMAAGHARATRQRCPKLYRGGHCAYSRLLEAARPTPHERLMSPAYALNGSIHSVARRHDRPSPLSRPPHRHRRSGR